MLQIVELYPYIEYMKYLLPGSITLAMFVSVMIGGGMLYIDDKARGVHEGYLVTPITKIELVFGLNGAGAIKAVMTGMVITRHRVVDGRRGNGLSIRATALGLLIMILLTSIALQHHDVSADGAGGRSAGAAGHVRHPQHAAVFPQRRHLSHPGFPLVAAGHRQRRPFTYAVHGFKSLLLKETGLGAVGPDMIYLSIFAVVTLAIATPLFKRTL